jgi:hypothetical protein
VSKISQKFVQIFLKNVSQKIVNNLPFAQIVRRRRRRRRRRGRLAAPRPGGDFVAPGKNPFSHSFIISWIKEMDHHECGWRGGKIKFV